MYKLDLPVDLNEAALREKRKNAELQRQSRIFNSNVRSIGVDVNALDVQVHDKKIQAEIERKRQDAYGAQMVQNDKIACLLDERQQEDIRNLNKAISEFRHCFQKREDSREFDIYDPEALKKDLPARLSDNDPRCTISGVQQLMGEDLKLENRKKYQQEQLREWSLQQQQEWAKSLEDKKLADSLYDKMRIELDQKAMELQMLEEKAKQAVCTFTKDFNRAQAAELCARKMLEKQQEEQDNSVEITNILEGDLLSENPAQASSAFGPHRVVPGRWKGMTPGQLGEINNVQQQQIQEKMVTFSTNGDGRGDYVIPGNEWRQKRLKEEERQREAEWDRQRVQAARAMLLLERQQTRQDRELRKAQDHMNSQLSQAQKAQKIYLDKEVFTNTPTAQYFEQFNTTSR
ncbi:RIB43A-like with coiled-coils protein 2 isoform X2 [Ascaphus truei]|uniref:RIB43A-like with coiled-coils protein 2 isoform X2 n=1 Tax=Ascaphus truei TaxID=8439 RepID=UPI003F5A7019